MDSQISRFALLELNRFYMISYISYKVISLWETAVIRAIISLDAEEKRWLESMARKQHISMAAIIRNIIKEYRLQNKEYALTKIDALLAQTRGIWKDEDGSTYQHDIREEWDE